MADNKTVDILVIGATGFTGKLVVRYLHAHRERGTFTFGIAARSGAKLKALVADVGLGADVKEVVLDVADEAGVEKAVSAARVVVNAVGPFYPTSLPVARACARHGVHYVDITGETHYVRALIAELDLLASKTHAAIVPSCGFDSLPADVLVVLSARTLRQHLLTTSTTSDASGAPVRAASSHTQYAIRGGISGGTARTAFAAFALPKEERAAARDPFALSPVKDADAEPESEGVGSLAQWLGVRTLPAVRPRAYGVVTPLAAHDIAVVQRTRGLLALRTREVARHRVNAPAVAAEEEEGEDAAQPLFADAFSYGESTNVPGSGTFLGACAVGAALLLGGVSLWLLPPMRWLLERFVAVSGRGPSDETMEKGHLYARNVTLSEPHPNTKKRVAVQTTLEGKGDPGYALTAVMVSESALCLLSPEKLTPLGRAGGVLTPMSALGDALLRRLAASGRFEIESEVLQEA